MDFTKLRSEIKKNRTELKPREKIIVPQPGLNRYVLMPGWRVGQEEKLTHRFGAHYVKNEADELLAVYPCPQATFGDHCDVCSAIGKAIKASTNDDDIAVLKKSNAGSKYLLNVLALDSEDPNTPKILSLSSTTWDQVNTITEEWAEALFGSDDPMIVVIDRTGKGLGTKYAVSISSKRHKLPAGAAKALPNIDDFVKSESEEQMNRALDAFKGVAIAHTPATSSLGYTPAKASGDRPKTPSTRVVTEEVVDAVSTVREPSIADELASILDDDIDLG